MIVENEDGSTVVFRQDREPEAHPAAPMKDYHVAWEIDLAAESPVDAARRALDMVSDPKSLAHVFSVKEFDSDEDAVRVDLDEEGL
jgi:hypothetical protein